jgi:hypothetical protein
MAPPAALLAHLDAAKDSTALSLPYASIGDDGCNAIGRYMRENVVLKTIDLRGNNIRADGLVVLSHALQSSPNVVSVCMKWNHVGSHERGIQALCDVLRSNQSISHVDLRNNKLGPECGKYLEQMLRDNSSLTHLDLSWNELGPEGGKALLGGIQGNHSLIECQLSGNRMTEDTLHAIAFILRRNRQTAPMGAQSFKEGQASQQPGSPQQSKDVELPPIARPRDLPPLTSPPSLDRSGALDVTSPAGGGGGGGERQLAVQDSGLSQKLLQREQNYTNAEDARFFGEIAEYIDQLQLDVARNKKYRMDAEERERVVTKGFVEREMRYAQEMRELENLLAKAKADKDEILHDTQYLQNEIDRVKEEKSKTLQDRTKIEEIARSTGDRLRCDIRDVLSVKADLETQVFKCKRRQEEQEEENARLRTYLSKCKADLDRALR